jgi:hypothetical protein
MRTSNGPGNTAYVHSHVWDILLLKLYFIIDICSVFCEWNLQRDGVFGTPGAVWKRGCYTQSDIHVKNGDDFNYWFLAPYLLLMSYIKGDNC